MNSKLLDKFRIAYEIHQKKNIKEAKKIYKEILRENASHFESQYLLSVVYAQEKDYTGAIIGFSKALNINPDHIDTIYNLGLMNQELRNYTEAQQFYSRVIELDPNNSDAFNNLGNIYRELNKRDEAIASFEKAIDLNWQNLLASNNKANMLMEMQKYEEAIVIYKKTLSINKKNSVALHGIGRAYIKLKNIDLAIQFINYSLSIESKNALALNDIGFCLTEKRKYKVAINYLTEAIKIDNNNSDIYYNLGNAEKGDGRYINALKSYDQSIAINSKNAIVHNNKGSLLMEMGHFKAADLAFNKAISIDENLAEALNNKSHLKLLHGEFEEGWRLYEWRFKLENPIPRRYQSIADWNWQKNSRLIVWQEQGIGDQVMFISLINEIYIYCSKLIVQVDERLIPILSRSFPREISFVDANKNISTTEFDYQISMGSLCKYFRNTKESFVECKKNYLIANPLNNKEIRSNNKKYCGLSWKSNNKNYGKKRSIELANIVNNVKDNNFEFISLQYGDNVEEINEVEKEFNIRFLKFDQIDRSNNIDSLCSLINLCDFVITIDNTTVHLSGALGVRTYLLLPYVPDWRWMLDRDDSLWYGSIKIYRQVVSGGWNEPLEKIKKDLNLELP